MDSEQENDIRMRESFDAVRRDFPALVAGREPLGRGAFGFVVGDPYDAAAPVTKFLYQMHRPEQRRWSENMLRNETGVLRLLDGVPFGKVKVPKLVGEPAVLDHDVLYAHYTMTRIPGRAEPWREGPKPAVLKSHFEQAGRLLAQFQQRMSDFSVAGSPLPPRIWGGEIEQVPGLGDETNEALAAANRFLQANKKAADIHGDFHGGNVTRDADDNIVGLLDFAEASHSDNVATDFVNVPPGYFPHFRGGYERESGNRIEPVMTTMATISANTRYLNYWAGDPGKKAAGVSDLYRGLNEVKAVTGFTPPGF